MKNILVLFFVTVFSFLIISCGKTEKDIQFKRLPLTEEDGYMVYPLKKSVEKKSDVDKGISK